MLALIAAANELDLIADALPPLLGTDQDPPLHERVLRLAEENAVLEQLRVRVEALTGADGYRDMTLAQIHGLVASLAAEQVRPLEAERARLAAEVERLKGRALALGERKERIEADERARIRRELKEALDEIRQEPAATDTCIFWVKPSDLLDALDRIVPGED